MNSTLNKIPTSTCPTRFGAKKIRRKIPRSREPPPFSSSARPIASGSCTHTDTSAKIVVLSSAAWKFVSCSRKRKLSSPTKARLRGPLVS